MFAAPAESSSTNLEIARREGRWGGSQSLDEGEDTGFGNGKAGFDHPRDGLDNCLEDVDGFV